MTFRVMEVLDWIERECRKVGANRRDYEDCCALAADIQGKQGTERQACEAARNLLARRYPKQETLTLNT